MGIPASALAAFIVASLASSHRPHHRSVSQSVAELTARQNSNDRPPYGVSEIEMGKGP